MESISSNFKDLLEKAYYISQILSLVLLASSLVVATFLCVNYLSEEHALELLPVLLNALSIPIFFTSFSIISVFVVAPVIISYLFAESSPLKTSLNYSVPQKIYSFVFGAALYFTVILLMFGNHSSRIDLLILLGTVAAWALHDPRQKFPSPRRCLEKHFWISLWDAPGNVVFRLTTASLYSSVYHGAINPLSVFKRVTPNMRLSWKNWAIDAMYRLVPAVIVNLFGFLILLLYAKNPQKYSVPAIYESAYMAPALMLFAACWLPNIVYWLMIELRIRNKARLSLPIRIRYKINHSAGMTRRIIIPVSIAILFFMIFARFADIPKIVMLGTHYGGYYQTYERIHSSKKFTDYVVLNTGNTLYVRPLKCPDGPVWPVSLSKIILYKTQEADIQKVHACEGEGHTRSNPNTRNATARR